MSNKLSSPNYCSLLALLDEHIYSSFSKQENNYSITSYIPWDNIYKYFPDKSVFFSTLSLYHQTIIKEVNKIRSLVIFCEEQNNGIEIEHNTIALSAFLFHDDKSIIVNNYVEDLFISALSKFSMKSNVLHDIISKGKLYKTSPEDLKTMLGINYTNAMLNSRVLIPVEKAIEKLYKEGSLPFYIKIDIERAVIGRGSKIKNVVFNIINKIDLLRLARIRSESLNFILLQLKRLYPFDYPFIEEKLIKKDDKIIDDIYNMIRNIETDPDYHKLATPTLVKFKLRQYFDIKTNY